MTIPRLVLCAGSWPGLDWTACVASLQAVCRPPCTLCTRLGRSAPVRDQQYSARAKYFANPNKFTGRAEIKDREGENVQCFEVTIEESEVADAGQWAASCAQPVQLCRQGLAAALVLGIINTWDRPGHATAAHTTLSVGHHHG